MHMRCGGIDTFVDEWICDGCAEITGKTNTHIRQQKLLDLSSSGSSEIDSDEGMIASKMFHFEICLRNYYQNQNLFDNMCI